MIHVSVLVRNSTHAVIFGERVTFFPDGVTLDCSLGVELAVYDAVLFRLSGEQCPNLEDVPTETAIYQTMGGILYSLCKEYDR